MTQSLAIKVSPIRAILAVYGPNSVFGLASCKMRIPVHQPTLASARVPAFRSNGPVRVSHGSFLFLTMAIYRRAWSKIAVCRACKRRGCASRGGEFRTPPRHLHKFPVRCIDLSRAAQRAFKRERRSTRLKAVQCQLLTVARKSKSLLTSMWSTRCIFASKRLQRASRSHFVGSA